jgi:tyrosine-specific transport protein
MSAQPPAKLKSSPTGSGGGGCGRRRRRSRSRSSSSNFSPPAPTSSLLGSIALVAGTTVGAGILALPAKTLAAGFVPTSVALLVSWVYMASSGVLMAEVNVNTLCALERNAVSLSTMTEETLGVATSRVTSLLYAFMQYTLLVAYMLQGGTLLLEMGSGVPALAALPAATAGPPMFAAVLSTALLTLPPTLMEQINSVAVVGLVGSFVTLLALGAQQVEYPPMASERPRLHWRGL